MTDRPGKCLVLGLFLRILSEVKMSRFLTVATHNIMDAISLAPLLAAHQRLRHKHGLHLLCTQENAHASAAAISLSLGWLQSVAVHPDAPRLSITYDRSVLELQQLQCIALPRLAHVPLWQRLYTSNRPEQKHGLLAEFGTAHGRILVANFHLDAAGENAHRSKQLGALSRAAKAQTRLPLVACGDTNAFSWRRANAEPELHKMLASLCSTHDALDSHAAHPRDTHFFARANEPKLGQRIAMAFGRLGIDFPRRYDVVCSSLPTVASGTISTPESDHDLVWATVDPTSMSQR